MFATNSQNIKFYTLRIGTDKAAQKYLCSPNVSPAAILEINTEFLKVEILATFSLSNSKAIEKFPIVKSKQNRSYNRLLLFSYHRKEYKMKR